MWRMGMWVDVTTEEWGVTVQRVLCWVPSEVFWISNVTNFKVGDKLCFLVQ